MSSNKKKVVIIVPCYDEEASLPHLLEALGSLRAKIKDYHVDILLVNDGSTDGTQKIIEDFSGEHSYIYYREFSGNAGHQSALRAGLNAAAAYNAAVMMDADMQHPPELIPDMLKAWEDGAKIVQMVRKDTAREAGVLKYVTSKGYYSFINSMSSLHLEYGASDFRLVDRSVIQTVAESKENDLFLRGYFSWLSVPKANIPYSPRERVAGSSKYSLGKMFGLAYEGVLQFSERPLLLAVGLGMILAAAAFIYGLVLIIRFFVGAHLVSGWTSLMVTTLFLFGINFILIGVIGAYLAHAIRLEKQRPEFIISKEKLPD